MTEKKIDDLIVGLSESAKELLEESGKLVPVGMVIKENGQVIPCMLPFSNDEEKSAMYLALGVAMKTYKATRVVLINDVAMRIVDSVEDYKKMKENYDTEAPLTYPPSQRLDGIFLQEINLEESFIRGFFLRYEYNEVLDTRKYHELKDMTQGSEGMGGYLINQIKRGYESSEKILEEVNKEINILPLPISPDFPSPDFPSPDSSSIGPN